MEFSHFFGDARWIAASDSDSFPLIRRDFSVHGEIKNAELTILGFGGYRFFCNGKIGTDEYFLPLNSDFEERGFPTGELMTHHRVYVGIYDISALLREGKNALAVFLGNFWYTGTYGEKPFGGKKLCYSLSWEDAEGKHTLRSDGSERWRPYFLTESDLNKGESHDYSGWDDAFLTGDTSDGAWQNVTEAPAVSSDFRAQKCPRDKVEKEIVPVVLSKKAGRIVYDIGENTSIIPVICTAEGCGDVEVTVSEELLPSLDDIDPSKAHDQHFSIRTGGKKVTAELQFTWLACRYISVQGNAVLQKVKKVHTDIAVSSHFECSDQTLNWLYKTYLNTQLSNMHAGIPSDCPHLERRGYTGDGQLTCHAVMTLTDARDFYDKWIDDISDCQDQLSGHVQYTAPYTHCGGGIGGWGGAMIFVPYEYYRQYGDDSKLRAMFPQMLRYFDYAEAHSKNNLVVSDREGEWNLGEWCTLEPVILPAPFINTYFYVKTMTLAIEIAKLIGKTEVIPMLEQRIALRKEAITAAYFNDKDGNFLGKQQGANAFALDIGLGDEKTKKNFIEFYEKKGFYDTGIFGTEVVTRMLFALGRSDVAIKLMTASEPYGFGHWKAIGATALWEYWDVARSHSHPMFGAVTAFLPEYIGGIRQTPDSAGYRKTIIAPLISPKVYNLDCGINTVLGQFSVKVEWSAREVLVTATVPEGTDAILRLPGQSDRPIHGTVSVTLDRDSL